MPSRLICERSYGDLNPRDRSQANRFKGLQVQKLMKQLKEGVQKIVFLGPLAKGNLSVLFYGSFSMGSRYPFGDSVSSKLTLDGSQA